jgi:UBX domain-containing protein 1
VGNIFNQVRRSGGVSGTAEDLEQPTSNFNGVGRTLAGGVSEVMTFPAIPLAATCSHRFMRLQARQPTGPAVHRVTFYRNGVFTIDDGPPRQVADPANFPFINSISKVATRRAPTSVSCIN